MVCICRKDQDAIVLAIEKDFALLVRKVNASVVAVSDAKLKAYRLIADINKLYQCEYFEDDLTNYLKDLTVSIRDYISVDLHRPKEVLSPSMPHHPNNHFMAA